jgi:hypothetical protein
MVTPYSTATQTMNSYSAYLFVFQNLPAQSIKTNFKLEK